MHSFMGPADYARFLEKTRIEEATRLMISAKEQDLRHCLMELERGGKAREINRYRVSLLHFAAMNKYDGVDITKHMTSQLGLNLAAEDIDGEEPIHYTIRVGDFNFAQELLNMRNPGSRFNLLHFFVFKNDLRFAEVVHKRDPSLINEFDGEGRKALHLAAQFADQTMCHFLMMVLGAHPKVLSARNASVVHFAVLNQHHAMEIVRYLSTWRMDPKFSLGPSWMLDMDTRCDSGETPLQSALFLERTSLAAELLKIGASVRKKLQGKNMLQLCVERNKLRSARFVHSMDSSQITERDARGKSVIHFAAEKADRYTCDWLVDAGADITALCVERGSSALHRVGMNEVHGKDLVQLFLSLGFSLDKRDKEDLTPMHYALRAANLEVAEQMAVRGADLKVMVNDLNLLFYCVRQNNLKSAKLVHRLDEELIDGRRSGGRTILHLAAEYADEEVSDWLVGEGACVSTRSGETGNTVLHFAAMNFLHGVVLVKYFLSLNIGVDTRNLFGLTPLHVAIECGNFKVADELLKLGANLNVLIDHSNLLHFCATRNKLVGAKFVHERNKGLIKQLCLGDMTTLHVAAQWSDPEFCDWLVQEGVDPKARNKFNSLAWQLVPEEKKALKNYLRFL